MKKEDSKSPESDISGDIVRTITMLLTEVDDEAELLQEFPIKEEKIEEKMRELYKEITTSPRSKVPSPLPSPPSSPLSLSSPPFDVKSESCGASVSDWGSTVMAGVEYMEPTGKMAFREVGSSENGCWGVGRGDDNYIVGEKLDGCDLLDIGDEWLARALRWGPPLELEEFT